jgi:cytochrome oxidase assembly protein ShyY1
MNQTTLTILLIVALIAFLIGTHPVRRISGKSRVVQRCVARVTRSAARQPAADPIPRMSRNRWERRDLTRSLMTDDDYIGQITNPR